MKVTLLIFPLLMLISGCELLQTKKLANDPPKNKQILCVWKSDAEHADCDLLYWLKFWAAIEETTWPERSAEIDKLTDSDSDMLKKVLLSQGKSTPYQNRLRAQLWAESLFPKLSDDMSKFIQVALYKPSQSLLEMESALVTLSNINTQQMTNAEEQTLKLEQQQLKLEKQQNQIEQLLNIEASILQNGQEGKE